MEIISAWQGSGRTAKIVADEIVRRWGHEEVQKYNPEVNCFTYNGWAQRGYRVKRGEKAIRSHTFIKGAEKKDGDTKSRSFSYLKGVCLFYYLQVEKIGSKAAADVSTLAQSII